MKNMGDSIGIPINLEGQSEETNLKKQKTKFEFDPKLCKQNKENNFPEQLWKIYWLL